MQGTKFTTLNKTFIRLIGIILVQRKGILILDCPDMPPSKEVYPETSLFTEIRLGEFTDGTSL